MSIKEYRRNWMQHVNKHSYKNLFNDTNQEENEMQIHQNKDAKKCRRKRLLNL